MPGTMRCRFAAYGASCEPSKATVVQASDLHYRVHVVVELLLKYNSVRSHRYLAALPRYSAGVLYDPPE